MSIENPPAFPLAGVEENEHGVRFHTVYPGMTLRDYFAGQALNSIGDYTSTTQALAQRAYALADAMLAARQKDQTNDR